MKRRTWHYIYPPEFYECYCMKGEQINKDHKVTWSEYDGMIWCYDCKEDMKGFGGIFDGPIPLDATLMLLGDTCFHRWNMKKKVVEAMCRGAKNIYYKKDKAMTAKFLEKQKEGLGK